MKDLIKLLVQLQYLDRRILEKLSFIKKVPKRIHEVDDPLRAAKHELERMKQKTEGVTKRKAEKERMLEEVIEKIGKMKARAPEIKTNKEYQAHLKEIDAFESEVSRIEEEILTAMEELDVARKQQEEKEEKVRDEIARIEAFKGELDREVQERQKEVALLKEERSRVVGLIDPSVYDLYRALLQKGGGVAVTRADNEICLGCNMNIPPQLFVEIKKNEEIIQCPQCRRILYYPEE